MAKNKEKLQRFLNASIKAMGENERQFKLSFSSEEPYERYFGVEILSHSEGACNLTRLKEIGVVLFNHDRDKVLGKIVDVGISENRGIATIEFDDDEFAEKIRKKVANETLKGVSVGYLVDVWEDVAANKKSEDGRFTGPCSIAKKWTPFEISIVSVPADATVGVGRELEGKKAEKETVEKTLSVYERQILINKNRGGKNE